MAIKEIYEGVLAFQVDKVKELTQAELDAGTDIQIILNDGLISAMDEVGQKFSEGILFVPEMLMAAQAMKGGLEILEPHLTDEISHSRGTVVIGTVKGDLHDIGKNLVGMMFKGAGFDVVDIGIDQAPQAFVEAVKSNEANLIGMSALLTTTMPQMEETIKAVEEAGLRDQVKIMVGGAPVTQKFADDIGADAYASNAASAVESAKEMVGS